MSLSTTRGALRLAGAAFDHLTTRIHEFHRAISDLPFGVLGAVPGINTGSNGTRVIHDGITDGVYDAIRGTAKVLFDAADSAVLAVEKSTLVRAALPAPAPSRAQADVVSILSGIVGDHMATTRNPLAVKFGVYRDGRRLPIAPASFPDATPRIAVFLHGLCGNENVWDLFAEPEQRRPYPERLRADLGFTPLRLRYNSGMRISMNGRALSRLLDRVVEQWPVEVEEIVLIGHSMGGLVARSGAELGRRRGARWLSRLKQIVCLGTPHLGAPLERWVHAGTHAMHRVPLTRPIARLLDSRSLGIKDLRWGYTVHEEWRKRHPDEFWTNDRLQFPPHPGVKYRFIGAVLTEDPEHAVAKVLGDGLVLAASSLAADIAGADTALRVKLHHMALLNHPEIYDRLHHWLSE